MTMLSNSSTCLCFPVQRHFSVFALSFPGADALSSIYSTILTQHLKLGSFPASLQKATPQLVHLALSFHQKIATAFLPTAVKFHYIFNLRALASIFQGQPSALRHAGKLSDELPALLFPKCLGKGRAHRE